jgi:putative Ca2+/H+ antiporter (TMEM165/GDT1 family)
MNWQWEPFAVTFVTVFLAELGDKTQLATLNFAAKGHSFLSVFAGSALALVLASFLGAALGGTLTRLIKPEHLNMVAGALFIVLGGLILLKKI